MKPQIEIRDFIRQVLSANRFAVLATVSEAKPHSSFVAYTASGDSLQLIFATYRHTHKYANLKQNNQVSILIENSKDRSTEITVLTATGKACEVDAADGEALLQTHLRQHPELNDFLLSPDCAVFRVDVEAYQLVLGIDDIRWWKTAE